MAVAIYGESKEVWIKRLARLQRKKRWLKKKGKKNFAAWALQKELIEVESLIGLHRDVLKEFERREGGKDGL